MERVGLSENSVCKLGSLLDQQNGNLLSEIGLSEGDVMDGVGIFGEGCSYSIGLIAPQLVENGYTYVILDFGSHYRNVLYNFKNAHILRLGTDFSLNPLYGEGMESTEYTDLFVTAFSQTYGLSAKEERILFEALINAVESVEDGMLTLNGFDTTLREFDESTNATELRNVEEIIRFMKPLFYYEGKNKPFSSQQSMPISKLFSDLTIIELEKFSSHRFRAFIQALMVLKYLAYLRKTRNKHTPIKSTIVMIDSAEHLLQTRFNLPVDQRKPRFIYYLDELKEKNATFHVCSKFPSEIDPLVFGLLGTKIFHRTLDVRDWKTVQAQLTLNENQRNLFFELKSGQALMKTKWSQIAVPLIINRPNWLFLPPLLDSQIEEALMRRGFPLEQIREEREMRISKKMLERDFESNAVIAYDVLKTLKDYSNVTKTALIQFLTQYTKDMVLQVLRELERRGYATTRFVKKPHKMWILSLEEVGEKALVEWERSGQSRFTKNDKGGE